MTVAGNQLALSLNSKAAVDTLCRPPSYRQSPPTKVPNGANRRAPEGILTVMPQSTSSGGLVVTGGDGPTARDPWPAPKGKGPITWPSAIPRPSQGKRKKGKQCRKGTGTSQPAESQLLDAGLYPPWLLPMPRAQTWPRPLIWPRLRYSHQACRWST